MRWSLVLLVAVARLAGCDNFVRRPVTRSEPRDPAAGASPLRLSRNVLRDGSPLYAAGSGSGLPDDPGPILLMPL